MSHIFHDVLEVLELCGASKVQELLETERELVTAGILYVPVVLLVVENDSERYVGVSSLILDDVVEARIAGIKIANACGLTARFLDVFVSLCRGEGFVALDSVKHPVTYPTVYLCSCLHVCQKVALFQQCMTVQWTSDKIVEIAVVGSVAVPDRRARVDNVEAPARILRAALRRNIFNGDVQVRINTLYPFLCECSDGVKLVGGETKSESLLIRRGKRED